MESPKRMPKHFDERKKTIDFVEESNKKRYNDVLGEDRILKVKT